MKFAKACLPIVALCLCLSVRSSSGAVAYSNLPANPPNYVSNSGSGIYGTAQDPNMLGGTASLAMSFLSSQTGTLSSLTLGMTYMPSGNGMVNVYLAENPMNTGPFWVFASQTLLGQMTTTDQYGSTNSALTTLSTPAPLPIFSGSTYYLLLTPADANTSVLWNENVTGAWSSYYTSSDMGATFQYGGLFGSDAFQAEVNVTAIPEASTWLTGILVTSVLGLVAVRRVRAAKARAAVVRR